MRILTVRQPWAWAIIHGGKDVENRVRNIAGDYRGPVAIHVAQEDADGAPESLWFDHAEFYRRERGPITGRMWKNTDRGYIIGVAQLVDVHAPHPGTRCAGVETAWSMPDHWHLVFDHPRPLREPIPYRGALGLRRLEDETTARVLDGIAA